ncbi:hypothetical protein [Billgrantia saliphila]|uniref:hypothetical protein n=1 Tax=Billgrantia saliphila TaxID=1848458 RepID=UPI000CE4225B|nr:hypothetical protein [Halomonas saliphila]
MLSRDALKRIGVLGVTMGLVASPFAWSAGNDKEADATGEQGGTSTMTEGASGTAGSSGSAGAGSAGTNADQGTEWEEEKEKEGEMESGSTDGGSGEVSNDPIEAGAPGVEGGQGTQGGEEPEPNDTDNAQGEEENET